MRELDLLGVDEHHPHLVRRGLQQDRGQHRVDRARLARAGRAGDQQVRHLRQVGADRAARDVLAQPDRQRRPVRRRGLEDVAQVHDPAARVGDLDADRLLAGDRRQDADVGRGQRVGEVVLELGDLADLDAGRQPQLVAGDVRARDHPDHARLDVEVPERLDQLRGDLLLPGGVGPRGLLGRARELGRVRELPDEVGRVGDLAAVAALGRELSGSTGSDGPRVTPSSSSTGSSARRSSSGTARAPARAAPARARRAGSPPYRSGKRSSPDQKLVRPRGLLLGRPLGLGRLELGRLAEDLGPLDAHARGALERLQVDRPRAGAACRRAADLARGRGDGVRRGLDHARDRRAGQQQDAREEQEDGEDVRADRARERGHDPGEGLPRHAAAGLDPRRVPPVRPRAARAEPVPADRPSVAATNTQIAPERNGRTAGRTGRSIRIAPAGRQRDRHEIVRGAEQPAQPFDGLGAGAPAVPARSRRGRRRTARGRRGPARSGRAGAVRAWAGGNAARNGARGAGPACGQASSWRSASGAAPFDAREREPCSTRWAIPLRMPKRRVKVTS